MYQFLEGSLPLRIPQLYFADLSRESSFYLLVTECVPYAPRGRTEDGYLLDWRRFGVGEVLPKSGKYQDDRIVDAHLYYYVRAPRFRDQWREEPRRPVSRSTEPPRHFARRAPRVARGKADTIPPPPATGALPSDGARRRCGQARLLRPPPWPAGRRRPSRQERDGAAATRRHARAAGGAGLAQLADVRLAQGVCARVRPRPVWRRAPAATPPPHTHTHRTARRGGPS